MNSFESPFFVNNEPKFSFADLTKQWRDSHWKACLMYEIILYFLSALGVQAEVKSKTSNADFYGSLHLED